MLSFVFVHFSLLHFLVLFPLAFCLCIDFSCLVSFSLFSIFWLVFFVCLKFCKKKGHQARRWGWEFSQGPNHPTTLMQLLLSSNYPPTLPSTATLLPDQQETKMKKNNCQHNFVAPPDHWRNLHLSSSKDPNRSSN